MHHFRYREGELFCEEASLAEIAGQYGTPLYVYSATTIRDHYRRLQEALRSLDPLICYAVKANSNRAVLSLLHREGSGFDIVSGGELMRVLAAGGDPERCTFAGVGKSREEIEYALENRVFSFNVESAAELDFINRIAAARGTRAPVALRINPDVAAGTHKYVSTGTRENKFGISIESAGAIYERAAALAHVTIRGVQMHIGSQITEAQPFVSALARIVPLVRALQERHHLDFLSIGGGLGIVYESSVASGAGTWWKEGPRGDEGVDHKPLTIQQYADAILPPLRSLGPRILLEPGRLLVGNAGVLLTRVQYLKQTLGKQFAIVDAGMNDLLRPALYGSYHELVPLREPATSDRSLIDVVGPVCESGDFFAQDRSMPPLQAGDLLSIMSAGAYGFVMASNYNSRVLPAEVMVRGAEFALVRARQRPEDLVVGESDTPF